MSDLRAVAAKLPPPDRLALFLDVDGTLIGIRHQDRQHGLTHERLTLLERIIAATGGATAILTGRSVEVVDEMFAPLVMSVGGLQGADRRFPGGKRLMPVLTAEHRRTYETIAEDVARLFPQIEIEWKPAGMALVYDEGDTDRERVVMLAVERAKGLKVMPGRVAIDIVPADADKGHALNAFMAHETFASRIPVHVGDDIPDEPAFVAAQQMGGFGISVSRSVAGVDAQISSHDDAWAVLAIYAEQL